MVVKNDKNQQTTSHFDQSDISSSDNNRCIPNIMELHGSNRTETESETSERLSNNPTEMVKLYEKTNFKFERDNSYLPSTSQLPPSDKEIEIQKCADKNRQCTTSTRNREQRIYTAQ
jgi:hypothetical protein